MSEPITIYCTVVHEWGARRFQPGDAMTLVSPSLVRDLLAAGRWSLAMPEPEPAQAPVVVTARRIAELLLKIRQHRF